MKAKEFPVINEQIVSGTGSLPILLHLPHNSTFLPADYETTLTTEEQKREIFRLVDHQTDVLFSPFLSRGAVQILNPLCRTYFDPERFEDPKEEIMSTIGMGVFYTHTTDNIRFRSDDTTEKYAEKIARMYVPYHKIFYDVCMRIINTFGVCIVIDGHSYSRDVLPYERFPDAARPEIDLGTDDTHTPSWLRDMAHRAFSAAKYSVAYDQPYQGTLIPLPLYGDQRLSSLMLEVRRDVYLQLEPYEESIVRLDPRKVSHFHATLHRLIDSIEAKLQDRSY